MEESTWSSYLERTPSPKHYYPQETDRSASPVPRDNSGGLQNSESDVWVFEISRLKHREPLLGEYCKPTFLCTPEDTAVCGAPLKCVVDGKQDVDDAHNSDVPSISAREDDDKLVDVLFQNPEPSTLHASSAPLKADRLPSTCSICAIASTPTTTLSPRTADGTPRTCFSYPDSSDYAFFSPSDSLTAGWDMTSGCSGKQHESYEFALPGGVAAPLNPFDPQTTNSLTTSRSPRDGSHRDGPSPPPRHPWSTPTCPLPVVHHKADPLLPFYCTLADTTTTTESAPPPPPRAAETSSASPPLANLKKRCSRWVLDQLIAAAVHAKFPPNKTWELVGEVLRIVLLSLGHSVQHEAVLPTFACSCLSSLSAPHSATITFPAVSSHHDCLSSQLCSRAFPSSSSLPALASSYQASVQPTYPPDTLGRCTPFPFLVPSRFSSFHSAAAMPPLLPCKCSTSDLNFFSPREKLISPSGQVLDRGSLDGVKNSLDSTAACAASQGPFRWRPDKSGHNVCASSDDCDCLPTSCPTCYNAQALALPMATTTTTTTRPHVHCALLSHLRPSHQQYATRSGAMQGRQSHNNTRSLPLGGPNFAAPAVLVHPCEFKNPSSFLKIYGDPMCAHGMGAKSPVRGSNGNWVCANCDSVNFPRRFRCNKCEAYRDAMGDQIVADYTQRVYEQHAEAYQAIGAVLRPVSELPPECYYTGKSASSEASKLGEVDKWCALTQEDGESLQNDYSSQS